MSWTIDATSLITVAEVLNERINDLKLLEKITNGVNRTAYVMYALKRKKLESIVEEIELEIKNLLTV